MKKLTIKKEFRKDFLNILNEETKKNNFITMEYSELELLFLNTLFSLKDFQNNPLVSFDIKDFLEKNKEILKFDLFINSNDYSYKSVYTFTKIFSKVTNLKHEDLLLNPQIIFQKPDAINILSELIPELIEKIEKKLITLQNIFKNLEESNNDDFTIEINETNFLNSDFIKNLTHEKFLVYLIESGFLDEKSEIDYYSKNIYLLEYLFIHNFNLLDKILSKLLNLYSYESLVKIYKSLVDTSNLKTNLDIKLKERLKPKIEIVHKAIQFHELRKTIKIKEETGISKI